MKDLYRQVCDSALRLGADFCDVRAVRSADTQIVRQDGRADKLTSSQDLGAGVRALVDGAWGFSYTSELGKDALENAVKTAVDMARASRVKCEPASVYKQVPVEDCIQAEVEIRPDSVDPKRKMAALEGFEEAAIKKVGDKLVNSMLSLTDSVETTTVCNTFGTYIVSEEIRTRIGCMLVARDGDVLQKGMKIVGKARGYEVVESLSAEDFSLQAAEEVLLLLSADPAPAGKYPVVFHSSVTGLLTHEALGHNAEADHVLSGMSIIDRRRGEQIASPLVSITDDPQIAGAWGTFVYDSEGTHAVKRNIVENGVLTGFLHDLETAEKMNVVPHGAGRADGYANRPIVRMSNTFIERGETPVEDIIAGIDEGIYLKHALGGYVNPQSGRFTCSAGESYLIENGKLARPLRDVSVTGDTLQTLADIDAVGNDFELSMPGFCGKNGQSMPVDNGGPHVRVKQMVVGGAR